MNKHKQQQKSSEANCRFILPSSYDKANFISRICFSYMIPLFVKATRNDGLELHDLHRCSADDEAEKVMRRLAHNWRHAVNRNRTHGKSLNFGWIAFRTYAPDYILPFSIFMFEELGLQIAQPLLLSRVIGFFADDRSITYRDACWNAFGVCACTLLFCLMDHPVLLRLLRQGMRVRTACCSLMYRKALRLSRASIGETQVGQIVNIMANDMARIDEFSVSSIFLLIAPIQATMIVYIVWTYLGVSCFVGVAVLLLYIPFQAWMGKRFAAVRLGVATLTDARLGFMNEIIAGIRVIKMYCWERPFADKVAQARKSEVAKIRKSCYLKALNLSTFSVASRFLLFLCFVVYVLLGNRLTAEAVFVSMALFNALRMNMTLLFPNAISQLAELNVTFQRIQKFLLLPEIDDTRNVMNAKNCKNLQIKNNQKDDQNQRENKSVSYLRTHHLTASWNSEDKKLTLKDISVDLKPGDLLAVIGSVGSGKSSFLMSLLRELPLLSGAVDLCGSIAYAAQDAWSFNDSVRNNILFGASFDDDKYRKVIEVCALKRDLELMPAGDRTLVGERGAALSGGQKARINLARAVYCDADICLLDDPLSAVDSAVAEHIFEQCIVQHLHSKIRVLVTHQIQFVEKANKILILKDGECLAYGSSQAIKQRNDINFMSLLAKDSENDERQRSTSVRSGEWLDRDKTTDADLVDECVAETTAPPHEQKEIRVEDEQYRRGAIAARNYLEYIRAGTGFIMATTMITFTVLSQTLYHGSDFFLTYWTNQNQQLTNETEGIQNTTKHIDTLNDIFATYLDRQTIDIIVYTLLIVSLFITTVIRSISFFAICMRASVRLHNKIFARLLRTPLTFFESNPSGRILNRFSKDLGNIDERIPIIGYDVGLIMSQAIGVIITISIVDWRLLFPSLFLGLCFAALLQIYRKTARDIKRYDGITRSPMYSHLSTTIDGLTSIRAYGVQQSFEKQFYTYQNDQTSTWFLFLATSRTMGYLSDLTCSTFMFVIVGMVMWSQDILGGTAGLIISSVMMLNGVTQYGVRQIAEFENQMTSVERIVEYNDLTQEAKRDSTRDCKPSSDWPTSGQIVFDHMNLAYGQNSEKMVLKDICCTISGGEKIGIVGRTGAGKSSLIAALFRLTEPTGTIRIDGVDIRSIGLDDLRRKVSIIPQDPVVFSGTVRYNLDPFDEYSDADIWIAFEAVQLQVVVENFEGKLDAKIAESGGNLSVGQRQLICLARAILRRNRILVLDEATANVDHQTDSLIQATIRTQFERCTVLTIAHRLNTIIDYDRVLVLDAGVIREFDSPYRLLKADGSMFHEMCHKTGPAMYEHLYQAAKQAHTSKK